MDKKLLIKYLGEIVVVKQRLEFYYESEMKCRRVCGDTKDQIDRVRRELGRAPVFENSVAERNEGIQRICNSVFLCIAIGVFLYVFTRVMHNWETLFIVGLVADLGFFAWLTYADWHYMRIYKREYDKKLQAYNSRKNRLQPQLNRLESERDDYCSKYRYFEEKRLETSRLLGKMFGFNILYPTYQNTKAVMYILQYLASGRCDSLGGPHGAYNIYENERRLDNIVMNLENLNKNLKKVTPYIMEVSGVLQNQTRLIDRANGILMGIQGDVRKCQELQKINAIELDQISRSIDYQTMALR